MAVGARLIVAAGESDERDLVVASDFHMSSGFDPGRRAFSRYECFREDDALTRFLGHLGERATREGRGLRLVLLGDLLDFLHVEPIAAGRARRVTPAAETLDRIAAGHPGAFRALGELAAGGVPIAVVPGNHDVELARRSVQQRFVELVAEASGRPEAARSISFHPWIYYVPGVLYAEHGSQYHDLNAFRSLLAASREDEGAVHVPLGSELTRYLVAVLEAIDPPGDEVKPGIGPVLSALRARPALAARTAPLHARFLRTLVRRWRAEAGARRSPQNEDMLRSYADEVGLSYASVASVARLAAVGPFAVERRALRRVVLGAKRTVGSPVYLHRAALAIHRLLEAERTDVPFYVFGHSHLAEDLALPAGGPPRYVNAGTWSSLLPRALGPFGDRARFTFVEISRENEAGGPTARLLRWNDRNGRPEPYTAP